MQLKLKMPVYHLLTFDGSPPFCQGSGMPSMVKFENFNSPSECVLALLNDVKLFHKIFTFGTIGEDWMPVFKMHIDMENGDSEDQYDDAKFHQNLEFYRLNPKTFRKDIGCEEDFDPQRSSSPFVLINESNKLFTFLTQCKCITENKDIIVIKQ